MKSLPAPALITALQFQNAVELIIHFFLKVADTVLERSVHEMSDGAIVVFHAGSNDKQAIRLVRTENGINVEVHSALSSAQHSDHDQNASLVMGVRFETPRGGGNNEYAGRGNLYHGAFFNSIRLDACIMSQGRQDTMKFLILFLQLVNQMTFEFLWETEILKSWTAGLVQIKQALERNVAAS